MDGFDRPAFTLTAQKTTPKAKSKPGGLRGFLSSVTEAPRYLIDASITNPTRELAAQFTGNKQAYANAVKKSNENLGLGEKGTDIGNATKKLAGESAQIAGMALTPAKGAGVVSKVVTGAKGGALVGGGSAAANNENILKGTAEGGAIGGSLPIAAKALGLGKKGAQSAESTAPKGNFLKNLTTQGQQAQGRVSGVSAGSKVAGKELTPQDTSAMLDTFKREGINTGNSNNTLRDVTDKLKTYGQGIADHFKVNNAPLKPEDTKVIASNFISGLKTTDPSVLKQAQIVADDLEKNVKSTKDLWEFRKILDSRIPDSKFMDAATTSKVAALKEMRGYISKELGEVPGMKNYHDLADVKPFVSAEARRLNNPSGGILGRLAASGPVQKAENVIGKATEKVGNIGAPEVSTQLVDNAPPAVKQGILEKLTQPLGGSPAENIARGGLAGSAALPNNESQAQEVQDQQPDLSSVEGLPGFQGSLSPTEEDVNSPFSQASIQKAILEDLSKNGGKNVDTLLALYKTFGQSAPIKKTETQRARDEAAALTDKAIQQLDSGGVRTGLVSSKIEGLKGIIGKEDPDTLAFNTTVSSLKAAIAKARAGTSFTPNEEALLNKYAPTTGDSGQILRTKLQALQQVYSQAAEREYGTQYQSDESANLGTGLGL